MENEKYTERLARYILLTAIFCIGAAASWYFKNVIIYILLAVVVSLISQPVMTLLQRISIKGKKAPDWLLASLTLCITLLAVLAFATLIVPVVSGIVKGVSLSGIENAAKNMGKGRFAAAAFAGDGIPLGYPYAVSGGVAVVKFSGGIGIKAAVSCTDFPIGYHPGIGSGQLR